MVTGLMCRTRLGELEEHWKLLSDQSADKGIVNNVFLLCNTHSVQVE